MEEMIVYAIIVMATIYSIWKFCQRFQVKGCPDCESRSRAMAGRSIKGSDMNS